MDKMDMRLLVVERVEGRDSVREMEQLEYSHSYYPKAREKTHCNDSRMSGYRWHDKYRNERDKLNIRDIANLISSILNFAASLLGIYYYTKIIIVFQTFNQYIINS